MILGDFSLNNINQLIFVTEKFLWYDLRASEG
jgi:hypothetical protein